MSNNVNRRTFATNSIWKMVETLLSKGVSTIISIVLARILLPYDYGVVAITSIFIHFSAIVIQGGLSTSLVRKKDIDNLDYSVALYFSLFVATVMYGIFYFATPFIADYYNEPLLVSVLRVQLIDLFFYSFAIVQNTIVVREFRFKELCLVSFLANLIGGVIGVIMAYLGYGVWSLVAYTLTKDFLSSFILLIRVKWMPTFSFSISRLKSIFKVSSWIFFGTVLDFVSNNVYNTVFGKKYTKDDLGYYTKGAQLPELVCLHTFGALSSVLLPTLSEHQDYPEKLKQILRKMVSLTSFVIFPMMGGMAVVGRSLIHFVFTEKWLPCVPILWATCATYSFNVFRSLNMQLIYASGESKKSFYIDAFRCILLITSVSIGIFVFDYNIYMVAFNTSLITVIVVIVTQWFCKNISGYTIMEWIKDMLPATMLTIVMCIIIYLLGGILTQSHYIMVLLIQVVTGIFVYVFGAILFKIPAFYEIKKIVFELLKGRN